MNLIKRLIRLFKPREMVLLLGSVLLSIFIILPVFTPEEKEDKPLSKQIVPSEDPYNTEGQRVAVFDTEFYIRYLGSAESQTIHNEVEKLLNDLLVPYHKLFDRHNDYFAIDPVNPKKPTAEEKATLPRIKNLKYINEHKNEEIEVEKPLYDLLTAAHSLTKDTPNNAFSMFIGEIYDFWDPHALDYYLEDDPLFNVERRTELERLVSFIPHTPAEIESALTFRNSEDKYYVTFNDLLNAGEELSISVGATAKGMMTDVLEEALIVRGLTHGYIDGGTSSITFLEDGFNGQPLAIPFRGMRKFGEDVFTLTRRGKYRISTSGTYQGHKFTHQGNEFIRSHILNPLTGYPAQNTQQAVSVSSDTLSGLELDYLTTILIVLNEEEGINFLRQNYLSHDLHVAYSGKKDDGTWYVKHSNRFPGGENPTMIVATPFLEEIFTF